MDDLQFRREIYADPKSQDEVLLAALNEDPSKQQFANDIAKLDDKIKQALEVPVPEGLSAKLILRQTFATHQIQKTKKRVYLSIAASVAMVGGLLVHSLQFSSVHNNLGAYALAHVYHEEGSISNELSSTVSLESLNTKMAAFEGKFTDSVGKLLAADYCRFDGMKSLHLVYQGKTSPVNVFIVPKSDHLNFESDFSDSKLVGSSLGFKNSNVIVVGDKNESLSTWRDSINNHVNWST